MPEIFIDLIKIQAGVVPPDTQQKNNLISHSAILKVKFGQFLLIEANNRCAFPCCDKFLIKIKEGLSQESYEISKIEKNKDDNPNNLVALCPDCFLTYQTDNRKYITKQLLNNKKLLASAQLAAQTLSDIKLDEGIESVLTGMSKLKYSTCDITLEPKELTDKISTQTTRTLFLTVKNQVIENYVTVNKIFILFLNYDSFLAPRSIPSTKLSFIMVFIAVAPLFLPILVSLLTYFTPGTISINAKIPRIPLSVASSTRQSNKTT